MGSRPEQSGRTSTSHPRQLAAREDSDGEKKQVKVRRILIRRRVACIDILMWATLHLGTMVLAAVVLSDASQQYRNDIRTYTESALAGFDAATQHSVH